MRPCLKVDFEVADTKSRMRELEKFYGWREAGLWQFSYRDSQLRSLVRKMPATTTEQFKQHESQEKI